MRVEGFVNINGDPINWIQEAEAKRPKQEAESSHKGWRVVGIPPGALEEARAEHEFDAAIDRRNGKTPKEWNEAHWLMNAKRKPVRSKPYSIPQAAQECAALAERSGWLRVEVVELKRPKQEAESSHKGWRVVGIPPGALEEARAEHEFDAAIDRRNGKTPKEWNEAHWLMNAKRKPVRSKPYSIPQAAQECAALAERSGWLRVEVVELKREVRK